MNRIEDDRENDLTLALQLLERLPEVERKAIAMQYRERQSNPQIERALGLCEGHLVELKIELRKQFFTALAARRRVQVAAMPGGSWKADGTNQS